MNLHRNLRRSRKGIGTVFGMVFFLLIVMVVFASFTIILTQNTGLQQTIIQSNQVDIDRITEQFSLSTPYYPPINSVTHQVVVSVNVTNVSPLTSVIQRVWIKDSAVPNQNYAYSFLPIILQPGQTVNLTATVTIAGASSSDNANSNVNLTSWFVTERGRIISTIPYYPTIYPAPTPQPTTPFGLDGSNSTITANSNSISLTLNTNYTDDLIYVVVAESTSNTAVNGISANLGLTFTSRINVTITTGGATSGHLQTFYAVKPFSGPVIISVSLNGSSAYCAVVVFGISGANTALPFDTSSPPPSSTGTNINAQVNINTNTPATSNKDFIIGAMGVATANQALTKGPAFTLIATQVTSYSIETSAEYQIVPAPQTNLAVTYTIATSQPYAIVADAVKSAS